MVTSRGHIRTFNALHSWRHGGRACIEDEDEDRNSKEKSQVSSHDTQFTGTVVDDQGNKSVQIPRIEEDGILLVVPARINGKLFSALIDSGATRCFVTPDCCTMRWVVMHPS